ncbi:MAG TPA: Asp23/Gls24 family envelope stress response protein [bacterium]|nr:Asp23/Gls24 family envelope stress response protein [bacterium]
MEEEKYGNVKIDNDVLASIAGIVAKKVPGVHKIATSLVAGLSQLIRKKPDAGIKVVVGEDEVGFELSIIVDYGVNIPEVTYMVQKSIKEEVEKMSGLRVSSVDVVVHGVQVHRKIGDETETVDEEKDGD